MPMLSQCEIVFDGRGNPGAGELLCTLRMGCGGRENDRNKTTDS